MTNRAPLLATLASFAAATIAAACGSDDTSGSAAQTGDGGPAAAAHGVTGDAGPGAPPSDDAAASGDDGVDATTRPADASGGPADAAHPDAGSAARPGWTLAWADEFDGADGTPVDPKKWTHDVGGTGWGNGELEYYTDGAQNAVVRGGNLVITATADGASAYKCSYGACKYTSARLKTEGLFTQTYGRFEARAQMPTGKGLWPAIWMLGDDIAQNPWPKCGEIDFMETIGTDIQTNHGTLHMPNNNYSPGGQYKLPGGASFADAFHTFAIEWEPGTIRFYVDDQLYTTQTKAAVPSGDTWEFEHPFFLIVNVAVGGQWPGSPTAATTFPQTLKVDYIRVYQKDAADH